MVDLSIPLARGGASGLCTSAPFPWDNAIGQNLEWCYRRSHQHRAKPDTKASNYPLQYIITPLFQIVKGADEYNTIENRHAK